MMFLKGLGYSALITDAGRRKSATHGDCVHPLRGVGLFIDSGDADCKGKLCQRGKTAD